MRRAMYLAALLAALTFCVPAPAADASWTTYHRDGLRSGVDPDSSSPLPPTRLWQTSPALDGDIYGQPLVYGPRVYVATENDSIYALDAATGAVIWHKHLGTPTPENTNATVSCGTIGNVGITSTPVIDPATGRIYAVGQTWDGSHTSSIKHILVGLNLADGSPAPGLPITVDAAGSLPRYELQRPGLALDAGRILIGYGGHSGDCGDYHGWLVSAPENGSGPVHSFEVDPSGSQGAIWGGGNAPAIDASGNLWVATGNGASNAFGLQESVLKFSPLLNLLGHWTPSNWMHLDDQDIDLGSSEPLPLPGGMFFQIGKEGVGYLLSSAPAELFQAAVCPGSSPGEAFGGGVYYAGVIYVSCADGLQALALNTASRTFTKLAGWQGNPDPIGPPIIAAGLVWSVDWGAGTLYALDRASGATRFSQNLGSFDHFASPSAAGGRLFAANANRVTAFTIAKHPVGAPPGTPAMSGLKISVAKRRLTLALLEPATVNVVISQKLMGRKPHGHCRAHAKQGRRCQYTVRKRSQRFTARQGTNTLTLRLGGLAAGRYAATLTATAPNGLRSRTYTVGFRVKHR